MANVFDDAMKFVLLLEEHKDVLLISQKTIQKKKKAEAVSTIIPKWKDISGKELTQLSLFKKINNLKSRAKLAFSAEKPLSDWQNKILEITGQGTDEDQEKANLVSTESVNDKDDEAVPEPLSDPKKSKTGEEFLNGFETDETKLLSNEQLQRLVLLKQVKVLTLQEERLNRLWNSENGQDIIIDLGGLEGTNQDENPSDII